MTAFKTTVIIKWYEGTELEVTGYYTEAESASADMIDPPSPSEFEIISIKYQGINVENILNEQQHFEIEEITLQTIEDRI